MNTLLALGLSNIAVAIVLAIVACAAERCWRRPALTHGLWLLVFLKLLTPPLISVPVIQTQAPATLDPGKPPQASRADDDAAPTRVQALPGDTAETVLAGPVDEVKAPPVDITTDAKPPSPVGAPEPEAPPALPAIFIEPSPPGPMPAEPTLGWAWLPIVLGWIWLVGAGLWFALAAVRLVRFHRLLRRGQPAPAELRALADEVAARMEVPCPPLTLVAGTLSPMLWVFGRLPRLVLPASLSERLTPSQWRTLLAHEMAHWRRRDHWVRWVELLALGLYWWCPLVWWAKRRLQQAEEECCDAWVVSTLPGTARDYALALVETVDFLVGARTALPPAASGLGHVQLLRRRLTMILRGRTPRALTVTGLLAVLAVGALLLPLAPTWGQAPPRSGDQERELPREGSKKADFDKVRRDLERAQQQLQQQMKELQHQMDQRRREFEEKLHKEFGQKQEELERQLKETAKRFNAQGFGGGRGGGGFGGGPGAAPGGLPGGGGFPGAVPGGGAAPGGGAPPPGGFGGGGGFGRAGGFPGGGIMPGGGFAPANLERRLTELERKLDMLMERLGQDNRPKAAPPGQPGPGGPGARVPPGFAPGGAGLIREGGLVPRPPGAQPRLPVPDDEDRPELPRRP